MGIRGRQRRTPKVFPQGHRSAAERGRLAEARAKAEGGSALGHGFRWGNPRKESSEPICTWNLSHSASGDNDQFYMFLPSQVF